MNTIIKFCLSTTLTVLALNQAYAGPVVHAVQNRLPAISGTWMHDNNLTSIRMGNNHDFIFCNEQNDCVNGIVHENGIVSVNRWNVTGKLNQRGNMINWSNGSQWVRPDPAQNMHMQHRMQHQLRRLDGRWVHAGKPTSLRISGDAKRFTITNEVGHSNSGYFANSNSLVIPDLNISGEISDNGNRIEWSNGTSWYRR